MTGASLKAFLGVWLAVVVAALAGVGAPAQAAVSPQLAQSRSYPGVDELWKQYPLDKGQTQQDGEVARSPAPPRSDAPSGATEPGRGAGSSLAPQQAQAQTQPRPADATSPATGSSPAWPWIGLGLLALAVGIRGGRVDGSTRAHARRKGAYAERHGNLYAEGFTDRDGIGAFRGFVSAVAGGSGPKADRMLCLSDPEGDEPLWVRRSEVATLRSAETATPVDIAEEPPQRRFRRSSESASRPRSVA